MLVINCFIQFILKSLIILANVIGTQRRDVFTNRTIFCSKTHLFLSKRLYSLLFSANENGIVKQNNQLDFMASFKLTNHIAGKWNTK